MEEIVEFGTKDRESFLWILDKKAYAASLRRKYDLVMQKLKDGFYSIVGNSVGNLTRCF